MRTWLLLLTLACAFPAWADEPYFSNVAQDCGLGGVDGVRNKWADIDGDGLPDLLLLTGLAAAKGNIRVLRAVRGPGPHPTFTDVTAASGLQDRIATLLLAGDVDNDGDVDLFCGVYCNFEQPKVESGKVVTDAQGRPVPVESDHGGRSAILLNDGTGAFTPVSDAGVDRPTTTLAAATFVDFDRDGFLDLYTGSWYRAYGVSYECYPDRLYRGLGDGRFEDVTGKAGLLTQPGVGQADSSRPTYGVSACDWNGDGAPDLLVCSYGRQWNRLWQNLGNGTFADVGPETTFDGDAVREDPVRHEPPFRANGNTFDCPARDFDNDGDVDVFLAEITHSWAGPSSDRSTLLVNQGAEAGFRFVRDEKRGLDRPHPGPDWNQGDIHAGWLDFDNDMLPDLLLASSDYPDRQILRLFRQKPDHSFEDATTRAGIEWANGTQPSLADFDRDGDVDIVLGNTHMRLTEEQRKAQPLGQALWRNEVGAANGWLGVVLQGGKGSNRGAAGARVRVTAGGVTQTRELLSGQGHAGHQDAPELIFGLAANAEAERVEVRWPDAAGSVTVLERVPARRWITIEQGMEGWREAKGK